MALLRRGRLHPHDDLCTRLHDGRRTNKELTMATLSIQFKVSIAWWVKPLTYLLIAVCVVIDLAPDEERIAEWTAKYGVKLTVAR